MAVNSTRPTVVHVPSEKTPLLPRIFKKDTPMYGRALSFVAVPVVLISLGVVAFMRLEGWPIRVSLFVVTQMVTTVGWGDFTVTTDGAKFFMAFYAVAILTVLAHYYNIYTQTLLSLPSRILTAHMRSSIVDRTEGTPSAKYIANFLLAMQPFIASVLIGCVYFELAESCVCKRSELLVKQKRGCIDTEGYHKCVQTGGEVKTFIDILYMCIISLATIGFGDKHGQVGRGSFTFIFVNLWLLIGVAATSYSVANLSELIFGIHTQQRFEAKEALAEIDEDTFKKIDLNDSGTLSRGEYISWVLVKYGLVSEKMMEDMNHAYDLLDDQKTNSVPLNRIVFAQRSRILSQ